MLMNGFGVYERGLKVDSKVFDLEAWEDVVAISSERRFQEEWVEEILSHAES